MRRSVLQTLATLAILCASARLAQVQRRSPEPPSAETDAKAEHVSFATEDGGAICADIYGQGDRGVVPAHGGRFTKASWQPQAQTLGRAGYRVLAFDFRGSL